MQKKRQGRRKETSEEEAVKRGQAVDLPSHPGPCDAQRVT